jgi:uncharacterized repeat protein (TIGR03803 family)
LKEFWTEGFSRNSPKFGRQSRERGNGGGMSKLSLWRTICVVCVSCALVVIGSAAQTFTTLVRFNGTDGAFPISGLVQGLSGNFYGTTSGGVTINNGTVYEITAAGKLTTLYSFCSQPDCTDGQYPTAGLVQATNGDFYGTTSMLGAKGEGGTVFKITPAGRLTTLHSFCSQPDCADGYGPAGGLVQATNGDFYGMTIAGRPNSRGTVFEITPAGKLTTLHTFCPQPGSCPDGDTPVGGLVQAIDGNLYGATSFGGANNSGGTVFKITPAGKLTTLYSFCSQPDCTDGYEPAGGLVQATNGNFYGMTVGGGADGNNGTVFEITPAGKLTTLHSFCSRPSCTDGANPLAGLVQATNGNFYGTTSGGGTSNTGSLFEITPAGKLTTLYSFCSQPDCTDGTDPQAALVQATNGTLYSTTGGGGNNNDGTVFSLGVGLGPFVETLPTSGKVGAAVIILGNNLMGATSVTFNGTPARFKVVSSTEITTTVPIGATTGKVKVTTPSGILISNVNFRVTPTIASFSPTSGRVGTSVLIRGQGFTKPATVTFGGVKAVSVTVVSSTQIKAVVPTGAKTGKITVTTSDGVATSAGTFTVTK